MSLQVLRAAWISHFEAPSVLPVQCIRLPPNGPDLSHHDFNFYASVLVHREVVCDHKIVCSVTLWELQSDVQVIHKWEKQVVEKGSPESNRPKAFQHLAAAVAALSGSDCKV